ncbi:MAG: SRPBCC family protein [Dermatophilaceae bacterium]
MTANVVVTVERRFDAPRSQVFRAWVDPDRIAQWRGTPGWHVELATVAGDPRPGGRHRHVRVRNNDPTARIGVAGIYAEFSEPAAFVSHERVTGDPGIDPDTVLELRVELTRLAGDATFVRVVQGPYEPDLAGWHGEGWMRELDRLDGYLERSRRLGA